MLWCNKEIICMDESKIVYIYFKLCINSKYYIEPLFQNIISEISWEV